MHAIVLHRWPWQEHGLLVDLFTAENGRFRVIARSARSAKSALRATLQPFQLLDIDFSGRGEVKTLKRADLQQAFPLTRLALYSGLYLNELLQRLLPNDTELPDLFKAYLDALELLQKEDLIEPILRKFELVLLEQLGHDFSFHEEADNGHPILPQHMYRFIPGQGFVVEHGVSESDLSLILSGQEILQLADFQHLDLALLQQLKKLMRLALQPYLGSKPLQSRELISAVLKQNAQQPNQEGKS
ncbi:MAG: DNA repair protein RecO [Aliidiomarina sp.]|uniref:DNA repair protein RecO n=1 Tax=Aliidiomarina sp. TaxID=1872439 RepID=UPI0025BCD82D|nr:DNA repair protein RecO [Aliidiomarina sp.]MCH8501758.1 DNA repair protein RecO [Aliidiomarina sp.]